MFHSCSNLVLEGLSTKRPRLAMWIAAVLAFFSVTALQLHASQPVTIALSTVGNPGNAADTTVMSDSTTGYGQVKYTFNIGTYDVTVAQYAAFLNAVAQTDTYGLYNTNMGTNSYVGPSISRSGSAGSYNYAVMGSRGNFPITYVSWFDAARFSNWMANGQPTGPQAGTTTENGAYALNGATSGVGFTKNTTNPNTSAAVNWWIPSENEWYKAAYYDPSLNSGLGGYWRYATRSNTQPGNTWALRTSANEANFYNNGYTMGATPGLTAVGSFTNSASAYGTYDQAGDVFNWNDAVIMGSYRGGRGGSWGSTSGALASSDRDSGYDSPTFEGYAVGFRVANLPEPMLTDSDSDGLPDYWELKYSGTTTGMSPGADDDHTGMSNFAKFAFGLDPTKGSSVNPIIDTSALQSAGKFSYTRAANSALTYTVLTSTDLSDWGTTPAAATQVPRVPAVNSVETVDVTLTSYTHPPGGKLFVRVKAQ